MERVHKIALKLFNDHNLIETCEVAVESTGFVSLGSPRDKSDTGAANFDPDKIKVLGDISVPILAAVLRKHSQHTISETCLKIVCGKSPKQFFNIFHYLTGLLRFTIFMFVIRPRAPDVTC